jgi:hypothetical protein
VKKWLTLDNYKVTFKREFAIGKKATPQNTGLACQETKCQKLISGLVWHIPKLLRASGTK